MKIKPTKHHVCFFCKDGYLFEETDNGIIKKANLVTILPYKVADYNPIPLNLFYDFSQLLENTSKIKRGWKEGFLTNDLCNKFFKVHRAGQAVRYKQIKSLWHYTNLNNQCEIVSDKLYINETN